MQAHQQGLRGCSNAHSVYSKPFGRPAPPCRPVVVRAATSGEGQGGLSAEKLFQQHQVLLTAGFSYNQAALIIQVSEQRKAASSAGPAAVNQDPSLAQPSATSSSSSSSTAASFTTPDSTAGSTTNSGTPAGALKPLEDRIAFLELELLKQSLATPLPTAADFNPADSSSSYGSTLAALNPAGAGAGGLNAAAAAAAASHWSNADSAMFRPGQHSVYDTISPNSAATAGGGPFRGAMSVSAQLATAAELGQLDPEVYALADALAVRQGFAGLPAEPYALTPQQQQQQRRPASIWGRSRAGPGAGAGAGSLAHYSRPLSANAWGASPLYDDPGFGEPLLNRQDLEEEVPYNPSGWAVAGTIVMVYLGVIVTFMAICVGDMPY